jgi:16S rRNA (guanine966-N2)-methyltransferase
VTRIIAGAAGGRRLSTPSGDSTRPTADRVREAVFSTLESAMGSWAGVRFLDLFAGSGAVGLEAASRGAARTVLVEQAAPALRTLRSNVAMLGLPGVEVHGGSVARFLTAEAAAYDVVFLDPPYADAVEPHLAALVAGGWLGPGAVVAVERASRSAPPEWPAGLDQDRFRRYGDTTLWYGRAS